MNTEPKTAKPQENERKIGLFDSIEIKGLSPKSARAFSSGRIGKAMRHLSELLAFTCARVYGLVFLSFGMLTLFMHLGEYYIMQDAVGRTSSMIIGALFILLSVFLLVSNKPICLFFRSSKILDFIVFDFFLINRMQKNGEAKGLSASVGVLIGFVLSLLGFFFPTEYAVAIIIGFIFVLLSFISPEFPYLFSLLIFPYFPLIPYSSYLLFSFVALSLISYIRKVLVGKRIYSLEVYDLLLIVFVIFLFISFAVTGGTGAALERSLILAVLVIGYVPASNMPVNRRIFDCVSGAMIASSVPVGLYAIIRYVLKYSFHDRTPSSAFFDSAEMLALYLSAVLIFALYLSVKRVHRRKKIYYFSVFLISAVALVTTECFAVMLAVGLGICAFMLLKSRKISKLFILLLFAVPFFVFFFGESALNLISRIFSMSPSLEERGAMIHDSLRLFSNNLFFGVGPSDSTEIFSLAPNIYLALACRVGIFALISVLLILVIRLVHLGVYKKFYSDSSVAFYADAAALAAFSILVIGSFTDIFLSLETVYFFISVFATGSAALRVSKKEKEERLSYYTDLGTSDSAAIDVTLAD